MLGIAWGPARVGRVGRILLAGALLAGCGGGDSGGASSEAPAVPEGWKPLYAPERLAEEAPERFDVRFETSEGEFTVRVTRAWSPRGADRFYTLVKNGFYDDIRAYRVVKGWVVQFGLSGDGLVNSAWRDQRILDDPSAGISNTRGRMAFASAGTHTRTTEVFINLEDNTQLDGQGFTPFGEVIQGMEVVDAFYGGYGEGPPRGDTGPYFAMAQARGNAYLDAEFPELTRIVRATLVP